MRVFIVGSIGYGGVEKIREMIEFLTEKGFTTINQLKNSQYVPLNDFRNQIELGKKIVQKDLASVKKADVIILLSNGPSYGAAFEICEAKKLGKHVVFYAPLKIPTPWPIIYADFIVRSKKELISTLNKLEEINSK